MSLVNGPELLSAIEHALSRFRRWWIGEFLALFPEPVADWLMGRSCDDLVITPSETGVALELFLGRRRRAPAIVTAWADYSPDAIPAVRRRAATQLVLALDPGMIFERTFEIPAAAQGALPQLAAQELERRTPFRLDDIFHDHAVAGAATRNRLRIRQHLVRRRFVLDALAKLRLELSDIAAIGHGGPDVAARRAIQLRAEGTAARRAVRTWAAGLGIAAAALLLLAVGATWWGQLGHIDDLGDRLAVTRAKALAVRAAADGIGQRQAAARTLRTRKLGTPGIVEIWEEVTRILPDDAWLVELRVADSAAADGRGGELVVTMTGLSTGAAQLVGVVDGSPMFRDARLTAPILFDPADERERFVLEAKVRAAAEQTASAGR